MKKKPTQQFKEGVWRKFSALAELSEELAVPLMKAKITGMPEDIMLFVTVTTMARMLAALGKSREEIASLFSQAFNTYANVDQHMAGFFKPPQ